MAEPLAVALRKAMATVVHAVSGGAVCPNATVLDDLPAATTSGIAEGPAPRPLRSTGAIDVGVTRARACPGAGVRGEAPPVCRVPLRPSVGGPGNRSSGEVPSTLHPRAGTPDGVRMDGGTPCRRAPSPRGGPGREASVGGRIRDSVVTHPRARHGRTAHGRTGPANAAANGGKGPPGPMG